MLRAGLVVGSIVLLATPVHAQQAPQPFPRPGVPVVQPPAPPQPSRTPSAPTAVSDGDQAPTEAMLGIKVYPAAQFIASYDAGRGQRYYLFGTPASFVDVVAYYRTALKQRGDLVYEVPATHQFDVGRFDDDTMAFPPGVTIKDFLSDLSEGFPNPKPGGQPARFPTVIQIVPVAARQ